MISAFDLYIARRMSVPLISIVAVAALLLVLERMLRLFDFVISEGGPAGVVVQMMANLLPQYLGLAMPVGVFLGSLLAFRDLAQKSELDIMRASGLSLWRLARAPLYIAGAISLLSMAIVGWAQPYSRYIYKELAYDLRSGAFGASIKPGEFVQINSQTVLKINKTSQDGKTMLGVFMERRRQVQTNQAQTNQAQTNQGQTNNVAPGIERVATIIAKQARLLRASTPDKAILRLWDGMIISEELTRHKLGADIDQQTPPAKDQPKIIRFERQDIQIDLPQADAFRARTGQHREMTLSELFERASSDAGNSLPQRQQRAALHWRLATIFSILWLPLLAIPFALSAKRRGGNLGLVVGMSVLILYNELMEAMQRVAVANDAPYTTIWALFFAVMGLAFYIFTAANNSADMDPLMRLKIFAARFVHLFAKAQRNNKSEPSP